MSDELKKCFQPRKGLDKLVDRSEFGREAYPSNFDPMQSVESNFGRSIVTDAQLVDQMVGLLCVIVDRSICEGDRSVSVLLTIEEWEFICKLRKDC